MKKVTSLVVLAALVGIGAAGAAPQNNGQKPPEPAKPTPTFTARTELVLVPALVTDHSGAHVAGLTKDDFTVLENGVERKVSTFEEVTAVATPVARPAAGHAQVFTNQQPANFAPRRVNIIVLDSINTAFLDQTRARAQIIKFLSQSVSTNELTTLLLLTRGGIKVIHAFTTDPAVLVRALQKVRGQVDAMAGENGSAVYTDPMPGGDMASAAAVEGEAAALQDFMEHMEAAQARLQQEFAIEATLDAFRAVAGVYGGIPGRKALVWVTGSFPFIVDKPGADPSARSFTDEFQRVFEQLNAANVALYPIDARGLVTVGFSAADAVPQSAMRRGGVGMANAQRALMDRHMDTINTMETFADMTGGRAYYNTNDLTKAIARASEDSSAYYVLGYYVKTDEGQPGWHKLQVKVHRSGVQVRARTGFFLARDTETNPEKLFQRDILGAVNSPFDYTSLPISVEWTGQSAVEAGKMRVRYQLVLPANSVTVDEYAQNRIDIGFVAVARDPAQKTAAQDNRRLQGNIAPENLAKLHTSGLTYNNQLDLPKGEYQVKFVVRDNLGGRVGSLTAPLVVE